MPKTLFTGPRLLIALLVLVAGLVLWFMLRTPALEVETAKVHRGPMAVTIDELGETRVTDLYVVAASASGELLRLPHKPGTAVTAGEVVAMIQPVQPGPLDSRSYDQAVQRIGALSASLAAARATEQEARAAAQLARTSYQRMESLAARGFASRAQIDAARSERDRANAAVQAQVQLVDAARHELRSAEASLRGGTVTPPRGQAIAVRAPVAGTVLSQLHESGGPVAAGTPLLELGDPARLEIVSEMLSADAVKVRPGAAVEIATWGGDRPLKGRVQLVEPLGFRKISALGVEEQRVRVIIDLAEPRPAWERLGHGYRVIVRVAIWSAPDVLQVPVGGLFRDAQGWAAFVLASDGKARQRRVEVGQMNDETAEVRSGLTANDAVIIHPGEKIRDGVRVSAPD